MVNKKSIRELSKEANEYEREANRLRKSSEEYLTGEPQVNVAKVYKIAGDMRMRAGEYDKALEDYNLAIEHAHNISYISEIKKKMRSILRYYVSKPKRKMRGVSRKLGLEKRLAYGILSIASLVTSLFFISINITGYTIRVLSENSFLIGVFSFTLGLIFAFFYFKEKRKVKK